MENNKQVQMAAGQSAVAKTLKDYVSSASIKQKFEEIQGKNAGRFLASLLSLAANDRVLAQADPKTVLMSAQIAATLDLPINKNFGFAYILPYKNNRAGTTEAQFQIGYKGVVQLALRSGQYSRIEANEVYEGEIRSANRFTGDYVFGERTSDVIVGYLAYFKLVNGMEKYLYMSKEEVEKHAKKYSQSYRSDKYGTSLWNTMFDDMAKKTVLKLLLSKFGPMSVEMQQAMTFDQAVVRPKEGEEISDIEEVDAEYIDNQPSSAAGNLASLADLGKEKEGEE